MHGSSPGDFVNLRDIDPTIIQDIRYATSNNFVGRRLAGDGAAECVVKREVGIRPKAVQLELAGQNLSLKKLDCYRPARAVADMVAWAEHARLQPVSDVKAHTVASSITAAQNCSSPPWRGKAL